MREFSAIFRIFKVICARFMGNSDLFVEISKKMMCKIKNSHKNVRNFEFWGCKKYSGNAKKEIFCYGESLLTEQKTNFY